MKRQFTCRSQLNLHREAGGKRDLDLLSHCCSKPNATASHWKLAHSANMLHLTARCNFRVRLLLGCYDLESDTAKFSKEWWYSSTRVAACKICNKGEKRCKALPCYLLCSTDAMPSTAQPLLTVFPTPCMNHLTWSWESVYQKIKVFSLTNPLWRYNLLQRRQQRDKSTQQLAISGGGSKQSCPPPAFCFLWLCTCIMWPNFETWRLCSSFNLL